jgi:hypothetical protein
VAIIRCKTQTLKAHAVMQEIIGKKIYIYIRTYKMVKCQVQKRRLHGVNNIKKGPSVLPSANICILPFGR